MKILRFLLVLAVIGYVGWLAWPIVGPMLQGGADGFAGGFDFTSPQTLLWVGAIALYLIAALMLGSGNPKAAVAYFLGFIADAVLRLAIDRGSSGNNEIAARSAEAAPIAADAGIDPTWLILGVLVVVGLLIFAVSRRRRIARTPGQLSF